MNVATMQLMPALEAQAELRQYEALPAAQRSAQDNSILAVYRAIARGKPVIDVAQAIQAAGCDALCRPRLALCRAGFDEVFCHMWKSWYWGADLVFSWGERQNNPRCHIGFAHPDGGDREARHGTRYRAQVPTIPPRLRPARTMLRRHFILWEADWEAAPVDPLLLRPIWGNIFTVVGQWDLTPVERAVLNARLV